MQLIHQGTVVQTTFSVVDEEGNVVKTYNVGPSQQNQEDPLNIRVFREDGFLKAYQAVVSVRQQLEENLRNEVGQAGQVGQAGPEVEVQENKSKRKPKSSE